MLSRKLSNILFSKTTDYDGAKRWIDSTVENIWKNEESSLNYQFINCLHAHIGVSTEIPASAYMDFVHGAPFIIGHISNTFPNKLETEEDTSTDMSPEDRLEYNMRKVVLNLYNLYYVFI